MAYWVPIGGDSAVQGNVFHAQESYNHILCRFLPDVQLIGTLEMIQWGFMNGNFSRFLMRLANLLLYLAPVRRSSFSGGPGLPNICNKIDFCLGAQFGFGGDRWINDQYRAEFRWRF